MKRTARQQATEVLPRQDDLSSSSEQSAGTVTPEPAPARREPVEELLRRLEQSVRTMPAAGENGVDRIVSDAAGHAATLKETLSAQKEAQELLGVAQQVRSAASEQAEAIIREAQATAERVLEESRRHAERARQETVDWADEQRARVEELVGDLAESAARDAERVRAEALSSALAEAEQTARQHVDRAAARGARDAEAIREEARDVLRQSTSLLSVADSSVRELAGTVSEFVDQFDQQLRAMQVLLADAEHRVAEQSGAPLKPAEPGSRPAEPVSRPAEPGSRPAEPGSRPAEALSRPAEPGRLPDPLTDPLPADPTDTVERRPAGRPLGSLFRGPELDARGADA